MSSADVSSLASAVSGIQIEGPPTNSGRIALNEESVRQVLPGELDSRVGSVVQPAGEGDQDEGDEDQGLDTEADQDGTDDDDPEAPTDRATMTVGDSLFDAATYDTAPRIDGQAADELVVAFSGSVKFDATDDDARALFESLRLGKWLELNVGGFVSGKAGSYKENAEGESKVAGRATVKVDSLTLRRPEDL